MFANFRNYFAGVLLSLLINAIAGQNYCATNLCSRGVRHIACNNNGRWANVCPSNAALVSLTPAHRQLIMRMHNTKRNQIAGGQLSGYRPAQRMATMVWNNELAKLAELNVKQCKMRHDACHNTATFKASGQNLGWFGYSGGSFTVDNLLTRIIDMWWNEYKVANMNYINKYPSNYNGPAIGHFTAMAQQSNIAIGCAASTYTDGKWNNILMACNYATTNWIGSPVYVAGATASGCKKGRNANFRNLCAIGETYSGL